MRRHTLTSLTLGLFLTALAAAQGLGGVTSAVRVLSAEAGLFGPPGTEPKQFTPSRTIPLKDGQVFGWKMSLQTGKTGVLVREELTLPSEPNTWGDPEPGLKRKTSPDGRTATTEVWLEPKDGVIFHTWSVTQGDPKGIWLLRVWVDGQAERVFRLVAR